MSEENDYYRFKKSEFLARFYEFNKRIGKLISQKYGEKFADTAAGEIKQEYKSLYNEIPYIGGDKNSLTSDLVSGVQYLALYNVLKRHDMPLKEIGELAYKAEEELFSEHPELMPSMTDPNYLPYIKWAANESEKRKYPGDWVYLFIEGDEENDYGLDFIECGIHKFFHEHNADEFIPYLCAMDIIMSESGNSGLHRTDTLAEGGDKCNFRYKAGRETKVFSTVIKD